MKSLDLRTLQAKPQLFPALSGNRSHYKVYTRDNEPVFVPVNINAHVEVQENFHDKPYQQKWRLTSVTTGNDNRVLNGYMLVKF